MSRLSGFGEIKVTALDSTGASPDHFVRNGRFQTSLSIEVIAYQKLLPIDGDAPTNSISEILKFSLLYRYDMPLNYFDAETSFQSRAAMSYIVSQLSGLIFVPFGLDVPGQDLQWCPVNGSAEPLGRLEDRLFSAGAAIVRNHPPPRSSPLRMAVIISKLRFLPPNRFRLVLEQNITFYATQSYQNSVQRLTAAVSTAMSAPAANSILLEEAAASAPDPEPEPEPEPDQVVSELMQQLNELLASFDEYEYDPFSVDVSVAVQESSVQFETVSYDGGEGETLTCPICLNDVEIGSHVASIPCNHKFHGDCLLEWTERKNDTCPVCRCQL